MKKTILYIIGIILASYVFREFLYQGIRRHNSGEYNKLNTIFFKKKNFSTIIAGSSTAESHIIPEIFDSLTKQNSYNIGLSGQFMPVISGIIKGYLVHSEVPRNIILSVDLYLYKSKIMVYRFPRFFPYLSNEPLYKALNKTDARFWAFRYFPFYSMPFFDDDYLNASLRGYAGLNGHYDTDYSAKGFAAIPKEAHQNMDTVHYRPFYSLPEESIFSSLDSIIALCKKDNINIIFTATPIYYKGAAAILNRKEVMVCFEEHAKKYSIPFMDYTNDSICYNKYLFADPYHLNSKGAEIFTRKFAADARQYLVK